MYPVAIVGDNHIMTDEMNAALSKILLVDDDEITASNIIHALSAEALTVEWVDNAEAALEKLQPGSFGLIILDRMLPGMTGIDLIARLQERGISIPILLLSALATINDRVEGLDAGAQDYLVKPFAMTELVARVNAILRYSRPQNDDSILCYHDLTINRIEGTAEVGGNDLQLLPKEFEMLVYFVQNSEQAITRQMLLEALWGYKFETGTNVIDVHVSRLRKKIEQNSPHLVIQSERGVGYRLVWK